MVDNIVVNGGSEVAHLTAVRKLSLIMTFPHVGHESRFINKTLATDTAQQVTAVTVQVCLCIKVE